MATYIYKGENALTFPTLKDADGNVLVVSKGDVFDAPEGLVADGVETSSAKLGKSKVAETVLADVAEETEPSNKEN